MGAVETRGVISAAMWALLDEALRYGAVCPFDHPRQGPPLLSALLLRDYAEYAALSRSSRAIPSHVQVLTRFNYPDHWLSDVNVCTVVPPRRRAGQLPPCRPICSRAQSRGAWTSPRLRAKASTSGQCRLQPLEPFFGFERSSCSSACPRGRDGPWSARHEADAFGRPTWREAGAV